ncbi:MAG TPA: BatD family protein [Rhodothermales bacterium]|nr:BatD family protein [Rhodothermales bacterium]
MPALLLLLALLVAVPAAAQTTVQASAEPDVAEVGHMVAYTIEIAGDGAESADVMPPTASGLALVRVDPVLRAFSNINGEARLTLRWIYQASRPGNGQIGPAQVRIGGRTYATDPVAIIVGDPARLAPPPGATPPAAIPTPDRAEGELFIRAVPRVTRPYTGQQVVVDYVLYYDADIAHSDTQPLGAWQAEGLWREDLDLTPDAIQRRSIDIGGRAYYAVVLNRVAIYPTRSGPVSLGPRTFTLDILRPGSGPFGYFRPFGARFARMDVVAPGIDLTARPLPPGAPPGFSGAVGRFELTASLAQTTARSGEPLALTVTVEGTGNAATMGPPTVEVPPAFEQFAPYEDRTLDRRRVPAVGRKTFTYSLMPRAGGRYEVGVGFSYFDPERGEYRTLNEGPFRVTVTGGVLADAPGGIAGPAAPLLASSWARAASTGRPGMGWLLAAVLLPLAALAALAVARRGVRLPVRPRARPAGPFAAARAALDDPPAFYRALDDALAALPPDAAREVERTALRAVAERVRYAPGPPPERAERLAHLARAEALAP